MSATIVKETGKNKTSEDKKSELLLDSLEIKGYRCFEHLTIEKLGRVNLIVGKNNVGKTALLEALWIYSQKGDIDCFVEITLDRNERAINKKPIDENYGFYSSHFFSDYKHLFHNRPVRYDSELHFVGKFEIGSIKNQQKKLSVGLNGPGSSPVIHSSFTRSSFENYSNYFIKTSKLKNVRLIELWRNIELRASEEFVINALKIITDEIISVRLTEYPEIDSPKIPIARVNKFSEPIPLLSLGEGMNRLFTIALALANCKDGILLIDEVESGLHYSVLPDVWKLILKTARDLNVQVFATTHSYDCIDAFAQAAIEDEQSDGMLIRLARNDEQIKAFTFDETQLATITKEKIEVR